jgi:hypothetical protein
MSTPVTTSTLPQAPTFEQVREDLIRPLHKNTFANKLWIRFLIVIIILGAIAYGHQFIKGLGVGSLHRQLCVLGGGEPHRVVDLVHP